MKLLTALVIVQTILIAGLFWKVMNPGDEAARVVTVPNPVETTTQADSAVQPIAATQGNATADDARIRQIIREELTRQLNGLALSPPNNESPAEADPVSPAEYRERLDLANQLLDYYVQQGQITNAEMAELQQLIARLDPESRSQMMGLLSQAIMSGEIDGHL